MEVDQLTTSNARLNFKMFSQSKFLNTLEKELFLPEKELYEIMNIPQGSELSFNSLWTLAEYLDVDVEDLMSLSIDFDLVKLKLPCTNLESIPQKYNRFGGSIVHSIATAFHYLETVHPHELEKFRSYFLKKFQLPRNFFEQPRSHVDLTLILDTAKFINRYYPDVYYEIGKHAFSVTADSPIMRELASLQSSKPLEVYEKFFLDLSTIFDKNFQYKILKTSSTSLTFKAIPLELSQELFNQKFIYNHFLSQYRLGFFENLPRFSGFESSQITESLSFSAGELACQYEVTLSPAIFH